MAQTLSTPTASLTCTTQTIAPFDPIVQFCKAATPWRFLWMQPARDFSMVATGIADALLRWPTGKQALAVQATLAAAGNTFEDMPLRGPVLVGGRAFALDQESNGPWRGFPKTLLILPERLQLRSDTMAWELQVTGHLPGGLVGHYPAPPYGEIASTSEMALTFSTWVQLVEQAKEVIAAGKLAKVVLARAVIEQVHHSPEQALRQLVAAYPTCTICAVGWGDALFLCATPERLVRVQGRLVETMAMAGSAPRGVTPEQDEANAVALLASAKDRHEHQLVIDAIYTALAPCCLTLASPSSPSIVAIQNVHHLMTPITGTLRASTTLFDLVDRLHPTPAVGGHPRAAALAFIHAHEPIARGWYAGAVGWVGSDGSGEFAVALRSAIMRGHRAWLYAGCGIVAGSDAAREWAETTLKLRPMRMALGAEHDDG